MCIYFQNLKCLQFKNILVSHLTNSRCRLVRSLSVQLPWPFHTADIKSTVQDRTSSRLVKLNLEKRINDPFPKEFGGRSKWDVSLLRPWVDDGKWIDSSISAHHLYPQYPMNANQRIQMFEGTKEWKLIIDEFRKFLWKTPLIRNKLSTNPPRYQGCRSWIAIVHPHWWRICSATLRASSQLDQDATDRLAV